MDDKKMKFRLGAFVLGGLLLLLMLLYFFGAADLFTKKVKLVTVFPESVQGLTTGAAVKYRGAPVGAVSNITILIGERTVCVEMEVALASFSGQRSVGVNEFQKLLANEVRDGMRCRLEFAGITGLKFIDLDYFAKPASEQPIEPAGVEIGSAVYIPSVPSTFQDVSTTVGTALQRLGKIQFEEIAEGVTRSLDDLSKVLGDPALRSAIHRINDTAENLESSTNTIKRVLQEDKLNDIVAFTRSNLVNLQELIRQTAEETRGMQLPGSALRFRQAAAAITDTQIELSNTLLKFNQTLDSIRMLSDYLGTDPNSLLNGKKKPRLMDWKFEGSGGK